LRVEHHLDDARITECFRSVAADTGTMDLRDLLGAETGKIPLADRSKERGRV